MSAIAEAPVKSTNAQVSFRKAMDLWVNHSGFDTPAFIESAVEAVQWMAQSAFDRAEEVHTEHDRMILDLQGAVADFAQGKVTPPQLNDLQAELFKVIDHVKELQATIEDLMAGGVNPTTKTPVRARVNFTPPTKERGWNHEATVEPVYPDAADVDWDAIVAAQAEAYEKCEAEAIRRDRLEGRERRYFA